jgi:hypothetical protein
VLYLTAKARMNQPGAINTSTFSSNASAISLLWSHLHFTSAVVWAPCVSKGRGHEVLSKVEGRRESDDVKSEGDESWDSGRSLEVDEKSTTIEV